MHSNNRNTRLNFLKVSTYNFEISPFFSNKANINITFNKQSIIDSREFNYERGSEKLVGLLNIYSEIIQHLRVLITDHKFSVRQEKVKIYYRININKKKYYKIVNYK